MSTRLHIPHDLRLPLRNLVHVWQAQQELGEHAPEQCQDGTCRRLTLDDCMKDLVAVLVSDQLSAAALKMRVEDAMFDAWLWGRSQETTDA